MISNDSFKLDELPDGWAVTWPDIRPIVEKATGMKLMTVLFEEVKCFEVGLGVKYLNDDPGETLWVDSSLYWQDQMDEFFNHIVNRYEIFGVRFHKQEEAERFYDYLEKKLVWWQLQHA
jgi:hypothetical protein